MSAKPLPSLEEVLSQVKWEESKQQLTHVTQPTTEATTMIARSNLPTDT